MDNAVLHGLPHSNYQIDNGISIDKIVPLLTPSNKTNDRGDDDYDAKETDDDASLSVTAGDDAKIRMWLVPEGGLTETLTEPECVLQGK